MGTLPPAPQGCIDVRYDGLNMLYAIPIILRTLFWASIPDPAQAAGTIRV